MTAEVLPSAWDKTLLWECPEGHDQAECRQKFETIRKENPRHKVLEAASLDDAALRKNLKAGFILLTTLSEHSRLLRLAAGTLPLRIENGTLHWQDMTEPVKDGLRIYFVGKSPYSNGYCMVSAVGSWSSPFGAAGASFGIYRSDKLLREGLYDRSFSFRTPFAPAPPAPVKSDVLTPRVVLKQRIQVVYEVPAKEKEEVRHGLEKEFPPGTEILDADDAALKEKIKGSFFLLTFLNENSRLLRLVAEPLPLRIENGTLHWQDMAEPINDNLYIHFIGKNPYSNGYSLVMAVGSRGTSAAVNDGSPSFGIYRGSILLREEFYDRSFSFKARPSVTLAEAKEDIDQFFSTFERAHPNLLAKASAKDYEQLKQQTRRDVVAHTGKEGRITLEDLGYILRYAAAFLQDGHTEVWSTLTLSNSPKPFPPFWLKSENGRYFIATAADASLRDAEILAVNGVPIESFLKPVLDHVSGETSAWKAAYFLSGQSTWLRLPGLWGGESFALKVRDERGVEREQTVRTVGSDKFEQIHPKEEPPRETHVEFVEPGKIARFVYPGFDPSDAEKKKVDEIFKQIKERKTTDLIIDLRGNGGGDTAMQHYIFKYLYAGKFRNTAKAVDTMSPENLSSHGTSVGPFLGHLLVSPAAPPAGEGGIRRMLARRGQVITAPIKESKYPKPDSFFTGRIYLLIDNRAFSAAAMFSAMFRDYSVGKILGQETGETPTMFSSPYPFTLRNSGIAGRVSCSQYFAAKPKPGDDKHGVLPDIPISVRSLTPYRDEADPMLAFTLAYIRKQ